MCISAYRSTSGRRRRGPWRNPARASGTISIARLSSLGPRWDGPAPDPPSAARPRRTARQSNLRPDLADQGHVRYRGRSDRSSDPIAGRAGPEWDCSRAEPRRAHSGRTGEAEPAHPHPSGDAGAQVSLGAVQVPRDAGPSLTRANLPPPRRGVGRMPDDVLASEPPLLCFLRVSCALSHGTALATSTTFVVGYEEEEREQSPVPRLRNDRPKNRS